jgi:hypothetical protein
MNMTFQYLMQADKKMGDLALKFIMLHSIYTEAEF